MFGGAGARRLLQSQTVRVVGGVVGGNLAATVIGLIGTLVQARFVGPDDLGYLRQFGIVTNYVFFLHLGLWHALQRRYPLHIGQGRRDQALAVAEICQSWNVAVALFATVIFSALAVAALTTGNWRASLAWLVQAAAIASAFYGGYLGATYRSGHDFTTAAKSSVLGSTVGLATLPLFPFFPYVALVLRNSLGGIVSLVYLHRLRPLRLPWRFKLREWLGLIKEGLPLFTASYGMSLGWSAVEASLVLKCFNTRALGLYSAALMVFELTNKIPQTITAVYAPRLTEHFGRTGSLREGLRTCWKPMIVGALGMALFVAACCPLVPFAVRLLMPKYIEAISPICLMLLYLPFMSFEMPYSLLIAAGHLIRQNVITYVTLGCFTLGVLAAVRMGWGLNSVVIASLLARLLRLGLIYGFIYDSIRRESVVVRTAA